jgi:ADP-ribose pyrophosphatase YjhB (NUDIX family)
MKTIKKIGGIIVNNKKMLVVRKKGTDAYIIPGGKPKGDETHQETLERELNEELNIFPHSFKYFGNFQEKSMFENTDVNMCIYFVEVKGEMKPDSEIVELKWIDSSYKNKDIKLGSVIEKHTLPVLIKRGLVK